VHGNVERLPTNLTDRHKPNLDIFWLEDKSLENSDDLPTPMSLAQEIADDLQTALDQFASIAAELRN
jgi:type I restriction enzyme M protein